MTGGEAIKRGLDLFDAEWSNIQAGQAWAVEHAETNLDAAQFCVEYPDAGRDVLYLRQHPRERIRWLEMMLTATRPLKWRSAEGPALGNLGNAYHALGDYRRAIDFHEQSLAIARELGDRSGEGYALFNLSLSLDKIGQRAGAVAQAEAALKIFEEIESPHADKVCRQLAKWQKKTKWSFWRILLRRSEF
jgi:tetratricopeptide (TPR) repeat protein